MSKREELSIVIGKLRKEYGPVIRTGPEELTIIDAPVPNAVDGPKDNCTKAVWYDSLLPEIALNTTRSKKDYDSRRRIWDNGFSTKALAIYEEGVFDYAEILTQRIVQLAPGRPAMRFQLQINKYRHDLPYFLCA